MKIFRAAHTLLKVLTTALLVTIGLLSNASQAQDNTLNSSKQIAAQLGDSKFFKDRLILRVKDEHRALCSGQNITHPVFQKWMDEQPVSHISTKFPNFQFYEFDQTPDGEKPVDLSLIYELYFLEEIDIPSAMAALNVLELFEYVEPHIINELAYIPSDAMLNSQSYLTEINALKAWDVARGSANVWIGINDTGTDSDHPDLVGSIANNPRESKDGIDNDGNGYVDDVWGWDFVGNDSDPEAAEGAHGTQVGGIAAASTNNQVGVASAGFDSKIITVRTGEGRLIYFGYEGIVYAADIGVDIMTCSWGSAFRSKFSEDVIDYATINKGMLVVCAAGNQNQEIAYFPSDYENALGVTASVGSSKAWFSNYSIEKDITAPGQDILTTTLEGKYGTVSGTSMSAPIVSGVAALVKSLKPNITALQLKAHLIATSDATIYDDPAAFFFRGKLGSGRVDAFAAVDNLNPTGLILEEVEFTDGNDDAFQGGEEIAIDARLVNRLADVKNGIATLLVISGGAVVRKKSVQIGNLNTSENFEITNQTLTFEITNPLSDEVVFELKITGDNIDQSLFLSTNINQEYVTLDFNQVTISATPTSRIGYMSFAQNFGDGAFLEQESNWLYEMGLMIGIDDGSSIKVMDQIRSQSGLADENFSATTQINYTETSAKAIITSKYHDSLVAPTNRIGIEVAESMYAFNDAGHQNYVVVEYKITNTSGTALQNLHVGLLADWDIPPTENNISATDSKRFIGYCRPATNSDRVAGVQLLSVTSIQQAHYFGMDADANGGLVDIPNGFTTDEKMESMRFDRAQNEAADVVQVISQNGIDIPAGGTKTIAFAIHLTRGIGELQTSGDNAYLRYNGQLPASAEETTIADEVSVFPNPFADKIKVSSVTNFEYRITNTVGQEVQSGQSTNQEISLQNLEVGSYILTISNNALNETFVIVKNR